MLIEVRAEGERGCGRRKPGGIYLMGGKPSMPCGRLPFPLDRCPACDHGIKPSRGFTWISPRSLFGELVNPTLLAVEQLLDRINVPDDAAVIVQDFRNHVHFNEVIAGACADKPDLCQNKLCGMCPMNKANLPETAGLLWVGGKFYKQPEDFLAEAKDMGISRRLSAVPKNLVVGETVIFLAHRECIAMAKPFDQEVDRWSIEQCRKWHEDRKIDIPDEEDPGAMIDPTSAWRHLTKRSIADNPPDYTAGVFASFVPTHLEYVVKGDETEEELEDMIKRGITPVKVTPKADGGAEDGGSGGS
jgi:hypothetical protein